MDIADGPWWPRSRGHPPKPHAPLLVGPVIARLMVIKWFIGPLQGLNYPALPHIILLLLSSALSTSIPPSLFVDYCAFKGLSIYYI